MSRRPTGLLATVAVAVLLTLLGIWVYFFVPNARGVPPTVPATAAGIVALPKPRLSSEVSVEESISQRRSVRRFTEATLTLADAGQLLWAAQGVTEPRRGFRAAPSAGATYPLELYLVVGEGRVEGLAAGVYRYLPEGHRLEARLSGDLRRSLAAAAHGQAWVSEAPLSIAIAANPERTTARYGERAIRYVHLEAGHVGQNVHLQAEALGLGTVAVGAFVDGEVAQLLGLPSQESPLYVFPVGRPVRR